MEQTAKERAWILYAEQGLSWSQVKYHLTEEDGIDEITARQIVDDLKQKVEYIENEEEEQRLIRNQERELQEIIKNEEGNTAFQRADKKIMLGVVLVGVGIGVAILCPELQTRVKVVVILGGISLIATGLRHRDIIYANQHKQSGQSFEKKQ